VQFLNPTLSAGEVATHAWYQRTSCTPRRFSEFCTYELAVDTREMLGSITVPTLVLHREGHSFIPVGGAQYLAERITGSRLVTFSGADSDLWAGNSAEVIDVIEEFLTGASPQARENRVLATVLFTDIVASTEHATTVGDRQWRSVLDDHDLAASREVSRFRGRLVKSTGDGIVATFDSPARAVQAADSLRDVLRELGLEIRAGIHTGEVEVRGDDIAGIAVHIASRVEALAAPSEVLVSRTVKDLVVGSGLEFQDRGTHALKGVPEPWGVFAVTPRGGRR
jgi:class 3 adenylate cyclase